jgi:hypothetical protein
MAVVQAPAPAFAPGYSSTGGQDDIFSSIEKLATLQARGILTEQEFATKKAELLSRL